MSGTILTVDHVDFPRFSCPVLAVGLNGKRYCVSVQEFHVPPKCDIQAAIEKCNDGTHGIHFSAEYDTNEWLVNEYLGTWTKPPTDETSAIPTVQFATHDYRQFRIPASRFGEISDEYPEAVESAKSLATKRALEPDECESCGRPL